KESTMPPSGDTSHSARRSPKRPVANSTRRLCCNCGRLSCSPSWAAIKPRKISWSDWLIPGKSTLAIFEPKHVEVPGSVATSALAPATKHEAATSAVNARIMPLLSNHAPEQRLKNSGGLEALEPTALADAARTPLIINVCALGQNGTHGSGRLKGHCVSLKYFLNETRNQRKIFAPDPVSRNR